METQLPHLWNPHKIKKIRQDETEIQNINLGGTCTRRLSPLGRKHLVLAGRDMCREIPLSTTSHHHFGNRSVHLGLCPHHRDDTTKWTTSSSIWYRFTSTETYPPLGNYTRNSIGRTERNLYSISCQKLNLFISKKSF